MPLIAGRHETLLRQRVDDAFARVGQQPRIAIVADGTPLAATLVGAGLGIAITHPVPDRARPPGVVVRQFLPHLTFAYAALYLGKAPTDSLNATFLRGVRPPGGG
jgi:DNA-binding transcriptional LysR family regulator